MLYVCCTCVRALVGARRGEAVDGCTGMNMDMDIGTDTAMDMDTHMGMGTDMRHSGRA